MVYKLGVVQTNRRRNRHNERVQIMSEVIDRSVSEVIPDHKLAAKELHAAFSALNPRLRALVTGGDVIVRDTPAVKGAQAWAHRAYNVHFVNVRTGHFANFTWKQGTGIESRPSPCDVLGAVCREFVDSDCDFESWADCYGYDRDSRQAEKTFTQCREHGANLLHLGLTREQIQMFAALSARL